MIRASVPIACLFVAVFALAPAAVAGPDPESPPPIDWRDFVDHDGDGDHVVGEEMCARESHAALIGRHTSPKASRGSIAGRNQS